MEKKLKLKKKHIVPIILLLAIYIPFIATRYSGHTTYVPFTGRVFSLNIEEIKAIRFQSGNTGRFLEYQNGDGLREVTELLNSYRYRVWLPAPPRGAGWSYRVIIDFNDGESFSYLFNSFSICVNGVWYYGNLRYFRDITNALNDLPPDDTLPATVPPISPSDIPHITTPPVTSTDIPLN